MNLTTNVFVIPGESKSAIKDVKSECQRKFQSIDDDWARKYQTDVEYPPPFPVDNFPNRSKKKEKHIRWDSKEPTILQQHQFKTGRRNSEGGLHFFRLYPVVAEPKELINNSRVNRSFITACFSARCSMGFCINPRKNIERLGGGSWLALQNITISLIFHDEVSLVWTLEWETCWLIIFLVRSSRFITVALSPLRPLISYSKSFVVQWWAPLLVNIRAAPHLSHNGG